MKTDPYAFTNSHEMGDVVEDQPRTYARHAMLDAEGKIIPIGPQPIPLDVWRRVVDPSTKRPTGTVKRERMRTLGEVFKDLYAALDLVVCEKCSFERAKKPGECGAKCKKCGADTYWFIDEYLNGPANVTSDDSRKPVPHGFRWVACYPVTGGSEGHYVHIDFLVPVEEVRIASGDYGPAKTVSPLCDENLWRPVRLALGKTFRGMDHAAEMARRCAVLLGA